MTVFVQYCLLPNWFPNEKASWYHYLEAFVLSLGRGERIRTFDPLVPNQMRYQAALRPDCGYSNRWPLLILRWVNFFAPTIASMSAESNPLPWLMPGDPFPDVACAWGPESDAPGLLAAGGELSVETLKRAYGSAIFPWFSKGQPVLWWSPNPRMVLQVSHFRLHRSLRKTLQRFRDDVRCEVRFDTAFERVIAACSKPQRKGQSGTWIVPPMVYAYTQLHAAGLAHSVETWVDGELVGGLYCVALGRAVFGESMFTRIPDASKIALSALISFCRTHSIEMIDCQQNTTHLASLGAAEMPRDVFVRHVHAAMQVSIPSWTYSPVNWNHIFDCESPPCD